MIQRLLIAVFTVLVFGAGFAARMLTENDAVVPPPPAVPGSEFVRTPTGTAAADPKTEKKPSGLTDKDRAKFLADIEKVRPQIEAYHKRLDEIATEFDHDFVTVLTTEQRTEFDNRQKKYAENRAKREAREAAETGPLTDQQIEGLRRQPLWNALWAVAINWRLERYTHDYKLDDAQQAKVRELLRVRREKFLALVDSTPPPSITYSDLARQAQKLTAAAEEPKK